MIAAGLGLVDALKEASVGGVSGDCHTGMTISYHFDYALSITVTRRD